MAEDIGTSGLLLPTDEDIGSELTCAGREASLGFEAIVGLYCRFSSSLMMSSRAEPWREAARLGTSSRLSTFRRNGSR